MRSLTPFIEEIFHLTGICAASYYQLLSNSAKLTPNEIKTAGWAAGGLWCVRTRVLVTCVHASVIPKPQLSQGSMALRSWFESHLLFHWEAEGKEVLYWGANLGPRLIGILDTVLCALAPVGQIRDSWIRRKQIVLTTHQPAKVCKSNEAITIRDQDWCTNQKMPSHMIERWINMLFSLAFSSSALHDNVT